MLTVYPARARARDLDAGGEGRRHAACRATSEEDSAVTVRLRDKVIEGYMKLKHGVDKIWVARGGRAVDMSIEQAIDIIQRTSAGRQDASSARCS